MLNRYWRALFNQTTLSVKMCFEKKLFAKISQKKIGWKKEFFQIILMEKLFTNIIEWIYSVKYLFGKIRSELFIMCVCVCINNFTQMKISMRINSNLAASCSTPWKLFLGSIFVIGIEFGNYNLQHNKLWTSTKEMHGLIQCLNLSLTIWTYTHMHI